jgi:hypothetical protein
MQHACRCSAASDRTAHGVRRKTDNMTQHVHKSYVRPEMRSRMPADSVLGARPIESDIGALRQRHPARLQAR